MLDNCLNKLGTGVGRVESKRIDGFEHSWGSTRGFEGGRVDGVTERGGTCLGVNWLRENEMKSGNSRFFGRPLRCCCFPTRAHPAISRCRHPRGHGGCSAYNTII
ncbi:hypothetical protein H257_06081 [Aphanomyces astaci]|uniref:Uncharacterized protein n=1 Tax=Aphanomyces astaci TaxID=112090 RepID=W4GRL3_APHAT|nr:hypothetical protein H257_06081 [Aphanomyces astaci]ETV81634.1 hypothetical protein H257_06081 [Aphanomyces astaci]|eukprot:XP_009829492.1 hypothetical protein H257_06081 [Aphanomyces astaci]